MSGLLLCALLGGGDLGVQCPADATLHGAPPPAGTRVWCARDEHRHGPMLAWYDDGTPKVRGAYDTGRKTGLWEFWHPNGKRKAEGEYLEGRAEGAWSWWHPNGRLAETGAFRAGLEHGEWVAFHDNGRLKESGNWVGGQRQGWWSEYDDAGRELRDLRYDDDEVVETRGGGRRVSADGCVVENGELFCRDRTNIWFGFGPRWSYWDPYWDNYWRPYWGPGFAYPRHRHYGTHRRRPGHRRAQPGLSPLPFRPTRKRKR